MESESGDGTVRLREILRKQKAKKTRRENAAAVVEPASGVARWASLPRTGGGSGEGGSGREGMMNIEEADDYKNDQINIKKKSIGIQIRMIIMKLIKK